MRIIVARLGRPSLVHGPDRRPVIGVPDRFLIRRSSIPNIDGAIRRSLRIRDTIDREGSTGLARGGGSAEKGGGRRGKGDRGMRRSDAVVTARRPLRGNMRMEHTVRTRASGALRAPAPGGIGRDGTARAGVVGGLDTIERPFYLSVSLHPEKPLPPRTFAHRGRLPVSPWPFLPRSFSALQPAKDMGSLRAFPVVQRGSTQPPVRSPFIKEASTNPFFFGAGDPFRRERAARVP